VRALIFIKLNPIYDQKVIFNVNVAVVKRIKIIVIASKLKVKAQMKMIKSLNVKVMIIAS